MSRGPRVIALVAAAAGWTGPWGTGPAVAAPAPADANQAVLMLRTARGDAFAKRADAVVSACRGTLRFALRDHAPLAAEVQRRVQTAKPAVARKALDLYPCFTTARFAPAIDAGLARPPVAPYAAEIAARLEEPRTLPHLERELADRGDRCLDPPSEAEREVCVWLAYALGPVGGAAGAQARASVTPRLLALLDSKAPKVREVTVESLFAWGEKKHAPAIRRLVKREKSGGFDSPNESGLIGRFEQRARALQKGRK